MKKTLIIVGVVVVGLLIARNVVAQFAITQGVKAATGVGVSVGSLDLGLFSSRVGVKGLAVLNPSGYPERVMVSMPELFVDYDLGAFLKGTVHLEVVRLNLAEIVVIKNTQGQVNVNSLAPVKESQAPTQRHAEPKPGKAPKLQIDLVELKVGRVVYKDYSQGAEPAVKEFAVNLDERYERVTNPQALAGMILAKALAKTTIAQLANIDVSGLRVLAEQQLKGAAGQLQGTANQLLDSTLGSQGASAVKSLFSGGGSKDRSQ